MWRIECAQPVRALLIEATNNSFHLPDKGLVGPHAIFDAAMLDTPRIDEAFKDQQDDAEVASCNQAAQCRVDRGPIPSIRSMRWAGTAICPWSGSTCAICARS
jgi:homogentisate 1,2-dioxygenase